MRRLLVPSPAAAQTALAASAALLHVDLAVPDAPRRGQGKVRILAAAALERTGLACRKAAAQACGVAYTCQLAPSQLSVRGIDFAQIATVMSALARYRARPANDSVANLAPASTAVRFATYREIFGGTVPAPETADDWPGFQALEGSNPRHLAARRSGHCCWPVGSSAEPARQLYCCEPVIPSHRYCRAHAASRRELQRPLPSPVQPIAV